MQTVLIVLESREPGNFHTGIINGFLMQKDLAVIPLICPRDVTFPWSVYDELILHAASRCKIDIFFSAQGEQISIETIKELKRRGIKTVCWQVDDPFILLWANNSKPHKAKLKEYSHVYTTNMESIKKHYPEIGIKAKFLPFGFDPIYHTNLSLSKEFDISFVGSSFEHRMANYILPMKNHLQAALFGCKHKLWSHPYRVPHLKMIEIANQTKVNLNFSDQPKNGVKCLKNRVMEIMGSGQFLLSETFPEARELFDAKELPLFFSFEELKEKALFYLSNEKEREKIARAGYKKVKENYSYKKLLAGVLEDLR